MDAHWIGIEFVLCSHRIPTGFTQLDLHRVHIGIALDSLRPHNGFTLDSHRIPFGHTLNSTSWTHTPNLLHMFQKTCKTRRMQKPCAKSHGAHTPPRRLIPSTGLSLEKCNTCTTTHGANTPSRCYVSDDELELELEDFSAEAVGLL